MDPISPGGVIGRSDGARFEQEYMENEIVMKTASAKLRRKAIASSSTLPMPWERERS